MRTNKLFKKTIAVIAAVCTLVNAAWFNGITAKASSITTINVNEECSGVITQIEDTSSEDYYTFTADESDSYYRLNIKAFDGDGVICYKVYTDAEMWLFFGRQGIWQYGANSVAYNRRNCTYNWYT